MAYLGRAGVDDVAKYICEHLCVAPTSAFVAYEPLGPIQHNHQHKHSVIGGYRAQYYQQFVDKLERGLATSSVDDVFHPLGTSHQSVESRLERAGFGFAKACLAGHAAACWIRLTSPEPFDEHAALALHLHSYALAVSFSFNVPLKLVRAMCPWSNATMQDRAPTAIQIKDGSSIIISPIEVRDQQVVQDIFVHTYEDLSSDLKAVRKMVKTAIKSDLQASDSDPCIARKYAMWGGIFLVARGEIEDRTVIGCIGVRLCQSCESFLPIGLTCFEVNRLLVDLSSRGKGIGTSLLQACHRFIETEVGPNTPYAVIATTPQLLTAANGLYLSFGYRLQKEEKLGGVVLNTYVFWKNELPS
jgi:GNAT superfamily N-acetyltransferase